MNARKELKKLCDSTREAKVQQVILHRQLYANHRPVALVSDLCLAKRDDRSSGSTGCGGSIFGCGGIEVCNEPEGKGTSLRFS